jgi:hypothetical protein
MLIDTPHINPTMRLPPLISIASEACDANAKVAVSAPFAWPRFSGNRLAWFATVIRGLF